MAVADKYRRSAQTWLSCLGVCLSAAAGQAQSPAKPSVTPPAPTQEQGAPTGAKAKDAGTPPPAHTKHSKKTTPAAQSGSQAAPSQAPATADAAPRTTPTPLAPTKPAAPPTKPACTLTDPEQPRGGRLELVAEHFGSVPVVRINGKPARILERRETRVSVQIPADSDGGPITVLQDSRTQACGTLVIIGKNR